MDDDQPSADAFHRILDAKRRAAQRKVHFGRVIQRQGADLEREGVTELADLEAVERVMKSLPTTQAELDALENHEPMRLINRTEEMLRQLRNEAAHPDIKMSNTWRVERSQREQVLSVCEHILRDGSWRSTEDLLTAMQQMGVLLTSANPAMRVSQILSQSSRFKTQRGRGWALVTSPGPDSPSSEADEDRLRLLAKRAVDREERGGRG